MTVKHFACSEMGKELYQESLELRNNDMKVKEWWMRQTAQKNMNELHPNVDLRMSNRWCQAFKYKHYNFQHTQHGS